MQQIHHLIVTEPVTEKRVELEIQAGFRYVKQKLRETTLPIDLNESFDVTSVLSEAVNGGTKIQFFLISK